MAKFGTIPVAFGSGFIVDESGLIATALHVVQKAFSHAVSAQIPEPSLRVGFEGPSSPNIRGNFVLVPGEMIEQDFRNDLALIKIAGAYLQHDIRSGIVVGNKPVDVGAAVAVLAVERPHDGESIAVSGYPLNNRVLITTSGTLATAWGVDIKQVEVAGMPPGTTRPDFKDIYLGDISVNGGNSGGPAYRINDAAVVGVCTAYRIAPVLADGTDLVVDSEGRQIGSNSGLSHIVPAPYVGQLIDRSRRAVN